MSGDLRARGLSRRARFLVYALAAVLVFLLWPILRRLALQALLGALLAWLALPLCVRLERRLPRAVSAALALIVCVLFFPALLLVLVPTVQRQAAELIALLPGLVQDARELLGSARSFFVRLGVPQNADLFAGLLQQGADALQKAIPTVIAFIRGHAGTFSLLLLAPVLAYYFLRDREALCDRLSLWIPLNHRKRVLMMMDSLRRELAGYFRGQLLTSACVAVMTALGLWIIGLPAWLLLGVVMGILETIPYIGPFLGTVPVVLFSLPLGMSRALWALGVVIAVQQIEGNVLSPRLMAQSTGLHPVTVLCLVSSGGMLGGIIGMLLALPVAVCLRGALRAARAVNDP